MNQDKRKRLDKVIADVGKLQDEFTAFNNDVEELKQLIADKRETLEERWNELKGKLEDEKSVLEEIRDEEQEGFDNLSEGLQQADNGQRMEEAVSAMEEALNLMEVDDFPTIEMPDLPEFNFEEFEGHIQNAQEQ